MASDGYVKVWRRMVDSGLMQMPETCALFLYLLLHASYQPNKRGTRWGVVDLQPGEGILANRELSKVLKQSVQTVRTSLNRLKSMQIITLKPTHHFSVFSFVNWAKYQEQDSESTHISTSASHTSNPLPTQEQEVKKVKNTPTGFEPLVETCYQSYPSKRSNGTSTGKSLKDKAKMKKTLDGGYDLLAGIEYHKRTCNGFIWSLSRFLNNLPDLTAIDPPKLTRPSFFPCAGCKRPLDNTFKQESCPVCMKKIVCSNCIEEHLREHAGERVSA